MVLAVLEARCGLALAGQVVYLNVAGGLRIGEPAADLAVAAALVSAATGQEVPDQTVIFGEIGLSGEIRPVSWWICGSWRRRSSDSPERGLRLGASRHPGRRGKPRT